jgi:hypothetical protein
MLLPMLAAAAAAGTDPAAFDIQCVIATESAMQNDSLKPEVKTMLMSAMTYFSGRVDAEVASGQLEGKLTAQVKAMEGKEIGPLLKQCGDYMTARGKIWTDIGNHMEASAKAPKG